MAAIQPMPAFYISVPFDKPLGGRPADLPGLVA
jgi:hypothetical protein